MGSISAKFRPGKAGKQFDPDEKWSNLYREREKNNIYRWVGVQTGGDLINIYEKDGEEGILRFAEEKISPLLFDDGKTGPHLIRLADYVKWRKAENINLGVNEGELESFESRFCEHFALWKLNKRGVEGENIIHRLLSREQLTCHEIARILIKKYTGLANDIFLGNDMFGQTALHLAIVHDDYETVQLLLQCGADVNARARGDFFLPEDWKNKRKTIDYDGWAYYGEYPLAFAACFGNKDIYDLLVEYGANPNVQDFFGNTILHMCVISNSSSMYSYAVRHWTTPADPDIPNAAGFTPLTLATKLGRKQIFEQMLELSKVEFWRFSDMACSAYPLNTLDTIRYDGTTNYDSALMTVINGETPEHLDMIGSEVIERLLADKWSAFARFGLYKRMAVLCLHLLFLSLASGFRPTELDRLYFEIQPTNKPADQYDTKTGPRVDDWFRLVFEILTMAFTVYYYYQQISEVRAQGPSAYCRNMLTTPAKFIYTVANLFILICGVCRFFRWYEVEEAFLACAVPGAFMYSLFFARSFKLTGPFIQMIYNMVAGDLTLFAIITMIFIVPFAFVFRFLGGDIEAKQNLPPGNEDLCDINDYVVFTYNSLFETVMTLFRATNGGYDYEELACANYELFTKVLFLLFMFIMPTILMNILIAMMGNTYVTVITMAEKAWRRQYAQIIMNLERSLNPHTLTTHMHNYSIKLQETPNGGEGGLRGLMVVKKTNKTRAGARRHATLNWKRIGKRVIHTSSRLGVDQAIILLHGHERLDGILEEEEKNHRRPLTRHRPVTVWRKGNVEIARIDVDSPRPSTAPREDEEPSRREESDVTTVTTLCVAALVDVPLTSPRQRVRGLAMFPSLDLPNMPGGNPPPTTKHPPRSSQNRTA